MCAPAINRSRLGRCWRTSTSPSERTACCPAVPSAMAPSSPGIAPQPACVMGNSCLIPSWLHQVVQERHSFCLPCMLELHTCCSAFVYWIDVQRQTSDVHHTAKLCIHAMSLSGCCIAHVICMQWLDFIMGAWCEHKNGRAKQSWSSPSGEAM